MIQKYLICFVLLLLLYIQRRIYKKIRREECCNHNEIIWVLYTFKKGVIVNLLSNKIL